LDTGQLADRFRATWARCTGGADPAPVWQTVEKRYTEPHRFYHNLDHLDHCLGELDAAREKIGELDAAREKIEEFDATELAIWFWPSGSTTSSMSTGRRITRNAAPTPYAISPPPTCPLTSPTG
jgi:hypothetical protein